jgi:2-dehydro-3-deoxy-D-arabinonate dehydratase
MKLFKTTKGILLESEKKYYIIDTDWDTFINQDALRETITQMLTKLYPMTSIGDLLGNELLPPIGSQEIWASGVTYLRSMNARMDESKAAGGGDFYDRVYAAKRPELFFKSAAHRAVGSGRHVRIRKDSNWNVPEPELTLMINVKRKIVGYTIGNDMSSRDIEGENPLYLPQAKSYDKSAAIGPCIYLPSGRLPSDTEITMVIKRKEKPVFEGSVRIDQIRRKFDDLAEFLYRETTFPAGCLLMTGTGIVPPNTFTLLKDDEVRITIEPIGTLVNFVE